CARWSGKQVHTLPATPMSPISNLPRALLGNLNRTARFRVVREAPLRIVPGYVGLFFLASLALASPSPGNRPAYLAERSPVYVNEGFPRLTTPMWFGEDGVDAAIILSIDDMRDTAPYKAFLEPILTCLLEIEGRSPLSIFTISINPADPQLETWLKQ